MRRLFTSESVTEGHPDKVCDQISDSVLDAILEQDPNARVACETAVNTGLVLVMGEITTNAYVDIAKIARETIKQIGFDKADYGFDGETCGVIRPLTNSRRISQWASTKRSKRAKIRTTRKTARATRA